ncbi:hypothetical protein [Ferrimicrobium sp.]|uniref:hypothetical protein n=1 Tax=Ferrimicrobium sp. TaxID=2926050 RepID=UPI002622A5CF|nr:hypothetical protein [Ferrimicrobium sp.]
MIGKLSNATATTHHRSELDCYSDDLPPIARTNDRPLNRLYSEAIAQDESTLAAIAEVRSKTND